MKVITVLGGQVVNIEPAIKAAVLYSPVSADFADIINRWGNGCFGDIAAGEQIVGCNSSDVVPLDLPNEFLNAYRFTASDAEAVKTVSPINYLDSVTMPIQIHSGAEDGKTLAGTPPEWSVTLTQKLRDAGKSAELYSYAGEGHSFIGQPWFDFMIRVLVFFNENL